MSQSTSNQLILIDLHALNRRLLLLIPLVLCLTATWFAVRWYTGNTLAEYGPGLEQGGLEVARAAVRLAPRDPVTHWRLGRLEQRNFAAGQADSAVRHFGAAVELSPNDYRLWMDYGRALEESGNVTQAEAALRHAVELAPAYAYPRWYLGNLLLRAGRTDLAFTELRAAAEAAESLRPPVFGLTLQLFGEDFDAIRNAMRGTTELRAQLASYLISNRKLDDALRLWNSLTFEEKKNQHVIGDGVLKALAGAKRFRAALDVARELAPDDSSRPTLNQLFNRGFETDRAPSGADVFGWQITSLPQAQATIDANKYHGGSRSLRVVLRSSTTLALNSIAQVLVVEPRTQYRLEFYVRIEDLRSGGTPVFEVLDETDGALLGASQPVPAGTAEWFKQTIDFGTKTTTEAIRLRINRAACGPDPECPIFGTVWYDDFNLQRAG